MRPESPERVFRVLLLDPGDRLPLGGVRLMGVRIVMLDQLDLIGGDPHRWVVYEWPPRPNLKQRVRDLTHSGNVDYVIIGNNGGSGLALARCVDRCLRVRHACVVWNELKSGCELEYAKLGYRRFMTRFEIIRHLIQALVERFGSIPRVA